MGNKDISVFNGVGFHTWQVKLKGYLMKKGLWSMITSEAGVNLTAPQQREFNLKDEKALGILLTSVSDEIVHHLDQATSAKIAWDTLERTFGAKGKHSKISLKMQLYSLFMQENETLSSVVNRLKSICTQLAHIQCNIDEDDKIAILLKSLPITYEHIVTVLKEKEPIPSLESIIHSLQEEENKHLHINEAPTTHALYVSNKKPCKHCGKTNHASNNCFKIKKCVKCGKIGHPPQFCPKGGNGGNGGSNGGNGGSSSKGRSIQYTRSDDDSDESHDGNGDGDDNIGEVNFVTPHASSSSSSHATSSTHASTSTSNKNHVKGGPFKGKTIYYSSGDDIL